MQSIILKTVSRLRIQCVIFCVRAKTIACGNERAFRLNASVFCQNSSTVFYDIYLYEVLFIGYFCGNLRGVYVYASAFV